ncbi:L,D-transpeptidase family protein [Pedobacter immunditicola]|uniref:L,D-transpeptidase family protein n=1 Tax=Pedobacter immunditicola TaxID=3133440 RepID=UPI0030971802
MEPLTNSYWTAKRQIYAALVLLVSLLFLILPTDASALNSLKAISRPANDTSVTAAIRKVLTTKAEAQTFHYPESVGRFYSRSQYQPVWITPEKDIRKTWEALLMLDCVLQFGLIHADYHPEKLLYSTMHDILDSPSKVDPIQKAWFDMLLSDAMITFMNHLHFGKLNPVYTNAIVDKGKTMGFSAEDILTNALKEQDFMRAVLNVQPKVKEYVRMQDYMKLLKGQYLDDCYEIPEGVVRKLAINMERLRWATINEDTFIQINIPSYTLKLHVPDTTYLFKVIVGKPASPTPVLQSSITNFSTAPDWKVPKSIFIKEILPKALKNPAYLENNHFAIYDRKGNYVTAVKDSLMMVQRNPDKYFLRQSRGCENALGLVVFRFQNAFGVYLHDTPEQQFFARNLRALSHGCIRIQHAEKLGGLLLTLDGQQQRNKELHQAMAKYRPKNFNLRKPVPLKITYLTCEMSDEGIVEYDDIYQQDKALLLAFYGTEKPSNH